MFFFLSLTLCLFLKHQRYDTIYNIIDGKAFKFTHLGSKTNLFIDLRDKLYFMYGTGYYAPKIPQDKEKNAFFMMGQLLKIKKGS